MILVKKEKKRQQHKDQKNKIARKQKSEEKQLCGYFKWQTNERETFRKKLILFL